MRCAAFSSAQMHLIRQLLKGVWACGCRCRLSSSATWVLIQAVCLSRRMPYRHKFSRERIQARGTIGALRHAAFWQMQMSCCSVRQLNFCTQQRTKLSGYVYTLILQSHKGALHDMADRLKHVVMTAAE